MNFRSLSILAGLVGISLSLAACDSQRGELPEVQLEKTAVDLELKAERVRADVKETAAVKEEQATELRDSKGDEASAQVLEKDAEVTREAGQKRAEQLEEQAERVRDQKKQAP